MSQFAASSKYHLTKYSEGKTQNNSVHRVRFHDTLLHICLLLNVELQVIMFYLYIYFLIIDLFHNHYQLCSLFNNWVCHLNIQLIAYNTNNFARLDWLHLIICNALTLKYKISIRLNVTLIFFSSMPHLLRFPFDATSPLDPLFTFSDLNMMQTIKFDGMLT